MKIKKAVLTGGGRATRLYPITTTINKHLLPLANKPMIFHAIEKVVEAGVTDIFINTNQGETELQKYIGDGGHWGVNITFYEQTGGPQGVAHIAKVAEKFIGNDPFIFYFSDNVLLGGLKEMVEDFQKSNYDCMLAFSRVDNPEHFGIPIFDANGKIIEVLEKPKNPPNNLAQTGIILYGPKVYYEAFGHIEKSARGEYEISDLHSYLIKHHRVGYKEITGWWKDTGQPKDILTASKLLLESMKPDEFRNQGTVAPGAVIEGKVHIGMGTTVGPEVKIIGPVIVGENCVIENCMLGPNVTIGTGAVIRGPKIENTIILDGCVIESDIHIHDSMFGKSVVVKKKEGEWQKYIVGEKTVIEI